MNRSPFSAGNVFILCALLFSLQIIPRWWSDSIILDEEWELTASYYYWKTGDVWTPSGTTAPGALSALPLLFMDLKLDPTAFPNYENRSFDFLYRDNFKYLAAITVWGRVADWLMGLLIGFMLYRLTRKSPPPERVAAMVLWAFQPLLLAYAGTAKLDIPVTFWFILCLSLHSEAQHRKKIFLFAAAGFLAGLAASSRYNGIFILPMMLAVEILDGAAAGWDLRKWATRLKNWLAGLAGFAAALSLCYLPGTLLVPGHPLPFRFFVGFFQNYGKMLPQITHENSFFAGRIWHGGSYLLFPEQFFLKNPVSFLIFLFLGIFLIAAKKIKIPRWIWVSPAVYVGLYWTFNKGMFVRHVLPVYPCLILIAAAAFLWLWRACRPSPSLLIRNLPLLLLLWCPLSVLANYPHYLAYANDFVTSRQKPDQLFLFNWSLGQDVKRLAETARERGWKKVKFISTGRTDPYFYGMDWEPWSLRDLAAPQPGTVYVVDPCLLQQDEAYHALFHRKGSWLDRLEPTGDVGGTFYYYEIPGKFSPDPSALINSFPYYLNGVQPYHRHPGQILIQPE